MIVMRLGLGYVVPLPFTPIQALCSVQWLCVKDGILKWNDHNQNQFIKVQFIQDHNKKRWQKVLITSWGWNFNSTFLLQLYAICWNFSNSRMLLKKITEKHNNIKWFNSAIFQYTIIETIIFINKWWTIKPKFIIKKTLYFRTTKPKVKEVNCNHGPRQSSEWSVQTDCDCEVH